MSKKVVIEVNGTQYSNFTSINTSSALRNLSRSFSFNATTKNHQKLPFKKEDRCRIYIAEKLFLTGFIEEVTNDGSNSSHTISLIGRDKLCDLVDSNVGVINDLKVPISLQRCIELVTAHVGMDIKVIDDTAGEFIADLNYLTWSYGEEGRLTPGTKLFEKEEDYITPDPGDNAKVFCETLARKRQVLLVPTAYGNLKITKAAGIPVDAKILHNLGNDKNNVLSYTFRDSNVKRFRRYINIGQSGIISQVESGSINEGKLVNSEGKVTDNAIRASRQMVFEGETATSETDSRNRAEWQKKIRAAQGKTYRCNVDGYKNQSGAIWEVGTLVPVEDNFVELNERMLLDKVSFILDNNGHNTNLSFVNKDVYKLESQE